MSPDPRVMDYEGSPYRTDFWEEADRDYEDAADRVAVAALLPRAPGRLVEIGAGYGRLMDLYHAADRVFLLDYARSMLEDAVARHGHTATYVCADLYRVPFAAQSIDTVVQVRVLHHVEDVPTAMVEVARMLRTGGSYVLEYANKRHAKALGRYVTHNQTENPLSVTPYEFTELNWNFHPAYVDATLAAAGLTVRARRSCSFFRAPGMKARLAPQSLARLDALLGGLLSPLALAPSQYVRSARLAGGPNQHGLWSCPACGCEPLTAERDHVPCPRCRRHWPVVDGVHHFRLDQAA